ncbi:hypothetical protein DV735_g5090, partial [Chaetothyriales sp. CBS 134920]
DYTTSHLLPEQVQYILALSEPLSIYSRYMDTLLVTRDDQPAFFDDLKTFRCQPRIMTLLTTPASYSLASAADSDPTPAVTRAFLASRFAHPWIRTSLPQRAFLNAEWSGASSAREEEARLREEQRINRLLVPICDAAAAANMFVGAAATGFLATNKRARKYMMKKLSKR